MSNTTMLSVQLSTGTVLTKGIEADYRDSVFTRTKDGCILPVLQPDALKRFGIEKWTEWSQIRLDQGRCYYLLPGKIISDSERAPPIIVMKSTIARVLGSSATPHQLLCSYLTIPNGQVKNFLNACRSMNALRGKEKAKILVAGSKAVEGGGLWHKYFCLYLGTILKDVEVHFLDYAEVEDHCVFQSGDSTVNAYWAVCGVTQDLVSQGEYDVLIDDVWTQSSGPGLGIKKLPEHFTLKGRPEIEEGFECFLHETETRRFSSNPRLYIPDCQCVLCKQIGRIVDTYEEYRFLRSLCARLGHATFCSGSMFYEQVKVAELLRSIYKSPKVQVFGKAVIRPIMSLTEELGFEVDGLILTRTKDKPRFQQYSRFKKDNIDRSALPVYPELKGKAVAFAGVEASILGATPIKRTEGSAYVSGADVIFVSNFEVWSFYSSYAQVYAPYTLDIVLARMPGWLQGVHKVGEYSHFYRAVIPTINPKVCKPYQRLKYEFFEPSPMFPFVQSEVLRTPLKTKSDVRVVGDKYSLRVEDGVLIIEAYSGDWRKSVFINEDGLYSLMLEDPRGENDKYLSGLPNTIESLPVTLDRDMMWLRNWEQQRGLWANASIEIRVNCPAGSKRTRVVKEAKKPREDMVVDGFLLTAFQFDEVVSDNYVNYFVEISPLKRPPIISFFKKSDELSRVPVENWTRHFLKERWKEYKISLSSSKTNVG